MCKPITTQAKGLFYGIVFFLVLFSSQGVFYVSAADEFSWKEMQTGYTVLRYQSPADLIELNKKIKYSPAVSGLGWLASGGSDRSPEDRLKIKIDIMFRKVQQILDMRRRLDRININLYQNRDQLDNAFHHLYQKECRLRAWYIYENHTIYLNLADFHEGMLAHEMAHAIIDHYFAVRPPSATAEILARYVDSHLFPR